MTETAESGDTTVSGDTSPLLSEKSSGSDNFVELETDPTIVDNLKLSDVKITIDPTEDDDDEETTEGNSVYASTKEDLPEFVLNDEKLPETVVLLRSPEGAKVYIVGTAHFSVESQNDVANIIRAVQPDVVVLELCASRVNIINLDEATIIKEAQEINTEKILSVVRQNGVFNGLMTILFLSMSAHITKELGMAPGGEFRTAFNEAKKVPHCQVKFGDRALSITLHRAIGTLTWWQSIKLAWHLLTNSDKISKEDVERVKRRDLLEELIGQLADEYPAIGEVFITERDIFLTHSLQFYSEPQRLPNGTVKIPTVVGVVGIGHLPGILRLWDKKQAEHVGRILTVPPRSMSSRILRLSVLVSLLGAVGYAGYKCVPVVFKLKNVLVSSIVQNISK